MMLRKPFTSLYALCTYQALHLLGLEREPLACHTPIPRMSYHHTQQDAMQQHAPHLEGLELEALVLFGEVIEVHLDQLVRHTWLTCDPPRVVAMLLTKDTCASP